MQTMLIYFGSHIAVGRFCGVAFFVSPFSDLIFRKPNYICLKTARQASNTTHWRTKVWGLLTASKFSRYTNCHECNDNRLKGELIPHDLM